MSDRNPADYRPCVGVMLVNEEGQVFVGKRIDNKEGDWWQMPQGGIDAGEEPSDAAYRELGEETGATRDNVELITRLDEELFYDLPSELQGKLWGGNYVGQRQTWYLARFTGTDEDIDLRAHNPAEFCEWKWVAPDLLPELIVPFKRDVYETIVHGFRDDI
ncbi:RNA pyrophosphohydrolase [Altericroceibacterium spongiae]|uniref:RNA pyrophosphohydrolase n=1 Tax=Altericroceibacterium spongiae TaxID=2320269 RepID=A0A420EF44_9SPHN|nr:RNA pyrophosphohydrolase [Altericroceibacterium spongiae]RKF19302.1 RNA pyrophosphohydrolase [Altericroceibacterium spongiae]